MVPWCSNTVAQQPYILPLHELDRSQLALAGGKAANLGETLKAGLPVPPGFCVTTHAYAATAEGADLTALLHQLAVTAPDDAGTLAALAARARSALLTAPIPEAVALAVRDAYAALSSGSSQGTRVAVRSSATAEDLPGASFAGQQDTYLNITGQDAVLDAVRRCWASLWTDRAVTYRAHNGIDPHDVRLAVVVQRQVDSAIAGVMFTANPLTGTRHQAVIDASPGLGEAVVSGAVTPDHFVVDLPTGRVVERHIGDKRLRIESLPDGGTRHVELPPDHPLATTACLDDAQLRDLARLARRVEEYYGEPQDTEWAIDAAGPLWLLQSRPITTLYPLPANAPPPDRALRVYFSFNVAQGVYAPLTPMGIQAIRLLGAAFARLVGYPVGDSVAGLPAAIEAGHRLFFDVTPVIRSPLGRRIAPFLARNMEARSGAALPVLFNDPRLSPARGTRRFALHLAAVFVRTRLPLRILRFLLRPAAARDAVQRAAVRALALADVPAGASAADRLDAFQRMLLEGMPMLLLRVVPTVIAGFLTYGIAARLLRGHATPDELQAVRRGLPHNPTTEMDLELWRLSRGIRADGPSAAALRDRTTDDLGAAYAARSLPAVLQQGLDGFLTRYGHRGVAEIDLGEPRWRDDPGHILGALANYLAQDDATFDPEAHFARLAAEADAAIRTLSRRAGRSNPLAGAAVSLLLKRHRQIAGLREAPKFHVVSMFDRGRQVLAPVAHELVEAGRLDAPEDVYQLTLPELRVAIAGADVRPIARRRHAEAEVERRRRRIPRWLLSDGTEVEGRTPPGATGGGADPNVLVGAPASSGEVTAKARVILDPTGARLEPGEILVAPSTDPGWTPLFLTAGGLVMEMGGPMSHGAVVAREYGIPAVVGVPGATERIHTGQTIAVDGSSGAIRLAP